MWRSQKFLKKPSADVKVKTGAVKNCKKAVKSCRWKNGFEPYAYFNAAAATAAAAAGASFKYNDVGNDDNCHYCHYTQPSSSSIVGTSAIVSEGAGTSAIVSSIPTRTSTTSPVTTSAFTPSHPKYRATLQTYVGEPQEKPQFLLPEEDAQAQDWGFSAYPRSQASTPLFEAADDVSSVKSRSIKSQEIDDPNPGLSFEERKKMETQEARIFTMSKWIECHLKLKTFRKIGTL